MEKIGGKNMRIENNFIDYEVPIATMRNGECFWYNKELHMRVDIGAIDRNNSSEFPVVVVNLEQNKLNAFKNDAKVTKIDAKIVIGES